MDPDKPFLYKPGEISEAFADKKKKLYSNTDTRMDNKPINKLYRIYSFDDRGPYLSCQRKVGRRAPNGSKSRSLVKDLCSGTYCH